MVTQFESDLIGAPTPKSMKVSNSKDRIQGSSIEYPTGIRLALLP